MSKPEEIASSDSQLNKATLNDGSMKEQSPFFKHFEGPCDGLGGFGRVAGEKIVLEKNHGVDGHGKTLSKQLTYAQTSQHLEILTQSHKFTTNKDTPSPKSSSSKLRQKHPHPLSKLVNPFTPSSSQPSKAPRKAPGNALIPPQQIVLKKKVRKQGGGL